VTIETVFSGFSGRFLHLFLGSFVSFLLTGLGFLCLILPGIYLWVAWLFTLALVADKRLDFWSAMELSRKMVTRHWWKLFAFSLVLVLLYVAGFFAFCLGLFIAMPIAMATLMYAYEDIFGSVGSATDQPATAFGPHGTAVVGENSGKPAVSTGGWKPATVIGLGAVAFVILAIIVISFANLLQHRNRRAYERAMAAQDASAAAREQSVFSFGPVIEQVIQARSTGTNQFLDLDNSKVATP
jgi:uncharacterized membrane protein